MNSKPVWRLNHGPWEAEPAGSRQNQCPLNTEGGEFCQVWISLASWLMHPGDCRVMPYHIASHLKKIHTWNAHDFLTGKNGVLGGERPLCIRTNGKEEEKQHQYQPACWSSHCLHARGGFGGPMDKEGRYIGSAFIDRTLMNCLPSVYWWMASSGTQVCWELQKLGKTKGHWDRPRQGQFLGTNAYLSKKRRHTSGEYGKCGKKGKKWDSRDRHQ